MSIELRNVSYTYSGNGPDETKALNNISVTIGDGEMIGLIGHTGCGKSTFVQHLNGLLRPTAGQVLVDGKDIHDKANDRRRLRCRVGLVFQYPEHQLFEETVALDVAFGPKNMGLDEAEVNKRVRWALEQVGFDPDEIGERSPFELSGGQKRRAAIAGVLAMQPETLVLDEPTVGLDPAARESLLTLIRKLHREQGMTVLMVTHHMDDIARIAGRVLVMSHGEIMMDGTPEQVFAQEEKLDSLGLGVPESVQLIHRLREKGWELPEEIFDLERLAAVIANEKRRMRNV